MTRKAQQTKQYRKATESNTREHSAKETAQQRHRLHNLSELRKVDISGMAWEDAMEYQRRYQQALYRHRCTTTRIQRKHAIDFTHITTID